MQAQRIITTALLSLILLPLSAVVISTGNDGFSLGMAENNDDLLTGSLHLSQMIGSFEFSAEELVFTERAVKQRHDVVNIKASLPFLFKVADKITLSGSIGTGISMLGNFAGDDAQNAIHAAMRKDQTRFHYPKYIRVVPLGEAEFLLRYLILRQASLRTDFRFRSDAALSALEFGIGAQAGYRSSEVFVSLAETWTFPAYGFIPASRNLSGPSVRFGAEIGGFEFNYRLNLKDRTSYMILKADLDKISASSWPGSEAGFNVSKTLLFSVDLFQDLVFRHELNRCFDLGLCWSYCSDYSYKNGANTDSHRTRKNYGLWLLMLSAKYKLQWAEPYLSLAAGVANFHVDLLTPEGEDFVVERKAQATLPAASLGLGVRLLPEGFLISGNSTVRMDFHAGLMIIPGKVWDVLLADGSHSTRGNSLFWYVGGGFDFSF